MRYLYFILSFFLLLSIAGCENVTEISPDINYQEYIVVRAQLKAYSLFEGVSFTKTLPLNENYDINKAELNNVTAYLKVDGIRIITLRYLKNGLYTPLDSIFIVPGSTYELFAQYNNTNIYAVTKVPQLPRITHAVLLNNKFIEITLRPYPDEVYGAGWEIYNAVTNNLFDESTDFQTIVRPQQIDLQSNQMVVDTKDLPDNYTSGGYSNLMYAQVYAFDSPYLKYFISKNNNQPTENIFAQGGDQVSWNVQGENVIGLFIGLAVVKYIKAGQ